jgi:bacteriocin-like protein
MSPKATPTKELAMKKLDIKQLKAVKGGGDPATDNHGFVVQVRQES